MRRTVTVVSLMIAGLGAVFAQSDTSAEMVPAAREMAALLADASDVPMVNITVGDLLHVAHLASLAQAQQAHVKRSATLSRMIPGLGQYVNGSPGTAIGFFAADVVINVAAAVAGYFLLPASVRYANLNYLQTPMSDIESRWKALSASELLPSVAIGASAAILSSIVRHFASRDARALALQAVQDGTVILHPDPPTLCCGSANPRP